MKYILTLIITSLFFMTANEAISGSKNEIIEESAFEIFSSPKEYIGKRVKTYGCTLHSAKQNVIMCSIRGRGDVHVGNIGIDSPSLSKDDRRKALFECAGGSFKQACNVMFISGKATLFEKQYILIKNAKITW
jgi:hypothetical protein